MPPHDDLLRLAEQTLEVIDTDDGWFLPSNVLLAGMDDADAAFIAACSPERIRDLVRENQELRTRLRRLLPMDCPSNCGPMVVIDEDGCCATCGADAVRSSEASHG